MLQSWSNRIENFNIKQGFAGWSPWIWLYPIAPCFFILLFFFWRWRMWIWFRIDCAKRCTLNMKCTHFQVKDGKKIGGAKFGEFVSICQQFEISPTSTIAQRWLFSSNPLVFPFLLHVLVNSYFACVQAVDPPVVIYMGRDKEESTYSHCLMIGHLKPSNRRRLDKIRLVRSLNYRKKDTSISNVSTGSTGLKMFGSTSISYHLHTSIFVFRTL